MAPYRVGKSRRLSFFLPSAETTRTSKQAVMKTYALEIERKRFENGQTATFCLRHVVATNIVRDLECNPPPASPPSAEAFLHHRGDVVCPVFSLDHLFLGRLVGIQK